MTGRQDGLTQTFAGHTGDATLPSHSQARTAIPNGLLWARFMRSLQWLQRASGGVLFPAKQRRLRVQETVSLGEKRFVAIVEVDGRSFLIGGGAASVSLLSQLEERPAAPTFPQAIEEAWKATEC